MRGVGLLWIACVGCGRIDFDARIDSGASTIDAPCTLGAFGPRRQLLPLASPGIDWGPSISPDKLMLAFVTARYATGALDLAIATRASVADEFSNVQPLTALNTPQFEGSPAFTSDGLTLYFSSARNGSNQLFRASRPTTSALFTDPPVLVSELMNTSINGSAVSSDENELFWGGTMISRAIKMGGMFVPQGLVPELNVGMNDGQASLSGDDLTIYFISNRTNGMPEIHVATRPARDMPFGAVTPMLGYGSDDPDISDDGLALYFGSNAPGDMELHVAERACL